ncbi:uncharacterized protein ColSpa_04693 [Colletotrichum spaethianum]|uniref:Uncharacterized protein n=1 Tax=Colletotrichum spaethianum TaxID=700344 RepID=A0AA37NWP5_9PEZI|nr:uncharacterized protein ColSpa_04693 [Colletotrichum spaethianum]GKT44512.1 hypothetical protein ColSpa_04693 [Colletotrichum spaethianum]
MAIPTRRVSTGSGTTHVREPQDGQDIFQDQGADLPRFVGEEARTITLAPVSHLSQTRRLRALVRRSLGDV